MNMIVIEIFLAQREGYMGEIAYTPTELYYQAYRIS
jgi:hypothetical protein